MELLLVPRTVPSLKLVLSPSTSPPWSSWAWSQAMFMSSLSSQWAGNWSIATQLPAAQVRPEWTRFSYSEMWIKPFVSIITDYWSSPAPARVTALQADNDHTTHSLTVSWERPGGVYDGYTLQLLDEAGALVANRSVPVERRSELLEGLTSGKRYRVRLVTLSGGVPSLEATAEGQTRESLLVKKQGTFIQSRYVFTLQSFSWYITRTKMNPSVLQVPLQSVISRSLRPTPPLCPSPGVLQTATLTSMTCLCTVSSRARSITR